MYFNFICFNFFNFALNVMEDADNTASSDSDNISSNNCYINISSNSDSDLNTAGDDGQLTLSLVLPLMQEEN